MKLLAALLLLLFRCFLTALKQYKNNDHWPLLRHMLTKLCTKAAANSSHFDPTDWSPRGICIEME